MEHNKTDISESIFHAIGRFVASFSSFHAYSELMVMHLLCPKGTKEQYKRVKTVLSELTTQHIVDSFFALIGNIDQSGWSGSDLQIVNWTRKAANLIIEKRNRIAHDIWALGHPNLPLPEGIDAFRVVSKKSTSKGLIQVNEPVTLKELGSLTKKTELIRDIISLLAICVIDQTKSPSDYLELDDQNCVQKRI